MLAESAPAPKPMDRLFEKLNIGKGKKNSSSSSSGGQGSINSGGGMQKDSSKMDSSAAQKATKYYRENHHNILRQVRDVFGTHGGATHEMFDSAHKMVDAGRKPGIVVQYVSTDNISRQDSQALSQRYVQSIKESNRRQNILRGKADELQKHINAYEPVPDYLVNPRAELLTMQADLRTLADMNHDDALPHHPFRRVAFHVFGTDGPEAEKRLLTMEHLHKQREAVKEIMNRHGIPIESASSTSESGGGSSSSRPERSDGRRRQ